MQVGTASVTYSTEIGRAAAVVPARMRLASGSPGRSNGSVPISAAGKMS